MIMKLLKYLIISIIFIIVLTIIGPIILNSISTEKCTLSPSDNITIEMKKTTTGMPDTIYKLGFNAYKDHALIDHGTYEFANFSQSELISIEKNGWFKIIKESYNENKYTYRFQWGELSFVNEEKCYINEFDNLE